MVEKFSVEALGEPLIKANVSWTGLPAQLLRSSGPHRLTNTVFGDAMVFLLTSGRMHGWVRKDSLSLPFHHYRNDIIIVGENFEVGECVWEGHYEILSITFGRARLATLSEGEERLVTTIHQPGKVNVRDDKQLVSLLRSISEEIKAGCPLGKLYAESLSRALLACVCSRYARYAHNDFSTRQPIFTPRQQTEIGAFIQDHLGREITLAQLADLLGLSTGYLTQLFKNTFGITPYQYVLRLRIANAERLLKAARLSIAEVALASGFSSQSHFTTTFSRLTGTTPQHVRRGRCYPTLPRMTRSISWV